MSDEYTGIELAIIGMAGRYPKSKNLDELWANLRDGRELISFFTREELVAQGVAPEILDDPHFVRAVSALEDYDKFDADFFGFLPREASIMDPQHRLFMECAWSALEHAGYDPERFGGPIGLFAGTAMNGYLLFNLMTNPTLKGRNYVPIFIANDKDFLPTRTSYKLNLKGPSCLVQSACSTALVALHLAGQSLLNYESDMVLAGGVAVLPHQQHGYFYQEGGVFSPDGHCRSFDAQGQGTIFGSGGGVVVLKRLADARADGDTIYAVVRGTAINNDGAAKVGYTAPSVEGQARVIQEALSVSGVHADTISYLEAHGTATQLGDPIELQALTKAYRTQTHRTQYCPLGTVKSNLGHMDAAAGVTGLIKTALALHHREIPPSLHYERPNPNIDFANSPFFVNSSLRPWERGATPRRAGVSAFGIGGTNAHTILEEAPEPQPSDPAAPWQLLLLSARTPTALDTMSATLATHLECRPDQPLADVAYTLQMGRRLFNERRMVVCTDHTDAAQSLRSGDPRRVQSASQAQQDRPTVFMFPGQGAQYAGMTRGLYDHLPLFRDIVDRCCDLLQPHLALDLRAVLFPAPGQEEEATAHLTQTHLAQPALFVIEYALAHCWIAWGVQPRAMIGHSIGEYVAACLAGTFTLEDALALVAVRGSLIAELPSGAMLSVPLAPEALQPLLGRHLSLATINAPTQCVVAGSHEAIAALEQELVQGSIPYRRLHTSHAFHSHLMEPILAPFEAHVRQITLHAPRLPWLSNVTGGWISEAEATDPTYWVRHLRQPVRFADGIAALLDTPNDVLLEVGPGSTLGTLAKKQPTYQAEQPVFASVRHPKEVQPDLAYLLETLGRLWLVGVTLSWEKVAKGQRRHRVPLPTYPFERKRYWIEPGEQAAPPPSLPIEAPASATESGETPPNGQRAGQPAPPHEAPTPAVQAVPGERGTQPEPTAVSALFAEQLQILSLQLELLRQQRHPYSESDE